MIDNEIEQKYSFSYVDYEGKIYESTIQTPGVTWVECLNDYVRFLESIYGYPIMHKIRLEEPSYLHHMKNSYIEPWQGEYFTKDEETKEE